MLKLKYELNVLNEVQKYMDFYQSLIANDFQGYGYHHQNVLHQIFKVFSPEIITRIMKGYNTK